MLVREIFAKTILSKSAIQGYARFMRRFAGTEDFCQAEGESLRAAFEQAGILCRML